MGGGFQDAYIAMLLVGSILVMDRKGFTWRNCKDICLPSWEARYLLLGFLYVSRSGYWLWYSRSTV